MDITVLKALGQIAGIAGISLGVLLLVFRDVVRKKIFPELARAHAYRLIRLIVILTFAIAALGIGAWAYVNTRETSAPQENVASWSANWETVNERIPRMGSSEGYAATNRERMLAMLRALDLSREPELDRDRRELVTLAEGAPSRQGDTTYNMLIPDGFDQKFEALRRAIRGRAIAVGVDVSRQD